MSADHGSRAHAEWSASATARNWNCSGALALVGVLAQPDQESEAAAWGTACHQIAEKCLRQRLDADAFLGDTEKTKAHEFVVDEEMAETAQTYVDYVRETADGGDLLVEQHFSLEAFSPPFQAGGTADAVLYHPGRRSLEVVDLKGGRGVVVEAKGNPQLRTYGLGAMIATPGLDVETVTVTIVQPRAPHPDGRIRSETFSTVELLDWTTDLLAAMGRSAEAKLQHALIGKEGGPPTFAVWAAQWLRAGDHCKFCPAAPCPAQDAAALDAAGVWFDALDEPHVGNAPDTLAPEQLAEKLDLLDMIEDWISAVRGYAHAQAELGVVIPHYQLVAKQGQEKWQEGAEEAVRFAADMAGLPASSYLNPAKLRTPKQVRKALGAKNAALVADLSFTPTSGTNLVREDKTSCPAAVPQVDKFFDNLDH